MRFVFPTSVALAALTPTLALAAPDAAVAADDGQQQSPAAQSAQQQIVVTASPFAHARDETPAIVAKVDAEQILKSGGSSIGEALANIPGVSSSGFAAGASRPIIRGMDSTRVRMLEDGTSSSDVSDIGPDHGVPIDPLAARSIEVVRGAGTLRYGSQAIGGVVNVLNNRVPLTLSSTPLAAEASGTYASVSDTWQGAGLVDAKAGNVALHADGFVRDSSDYDTPLGRQANSFFRGSGESAGASWFLGDGKSRIGAAVVQYDARYGIPSDITYIDMKQTKVLTKSYFDLGSGAFKAFTLDGSYANYQHQEKNPDGSTNSTFKNKEYDARAELVANPIGPFSNIALGSEYQHRAFSALGEGGDYLSPATARTIAGYVFTDAKLGRRFHLEASGRIESVAISGTPVNDLPTRVSYTPVSGAIGVLYEPAGAVKLGLTFASTARAPALTELFARGAHDGPGTYELGDATLKPERANSLEGSLRIRKGPFRFDGSVYATWFNNYIYGDLTGKLCDDAGVCGTDGSLRQLFYRQQGARFRGVEGEAHYDLLRGQGGTLSAKLMGDVTRATLDDGSNVPRIPPWRMGGGLGWQGDRFDAGINLIHAGRQSHFGRFDSATPAYDALDAQASWRPFRNLPGVEFAIVGQNLTNAVQRNAASLNKDLVISPGRNVRFVIKVATF
ncbi:TonB-dependent receptor [Novosphingobium sp. FKTRR1]|uniref:TonB-dependent receptor n=1 Tax=Novosphingobium sp. FKTRR1 TaxID=2879118 RepID=UPI001CF0A9C8|nr:TonB-dependent receptor [Novosphingobium sp. FKTRR1]